MIFALRMHLRGSGNGFLNSSFSSTKCKDRPKTGEIYTSTLVEVTRVIHSAPRYSERSASRFSGA
jgi:hypothetical protein